MATIRLGDTAPDFTQDSTDGPISFHDFLGDGWGILFSHPADFTPVCTTELGTVARLKPEFDKRNTRAVGLSVDPIGSHNDWVGDIAETQETPINFPLLADHDRKVAELYDMVEGDAATATVRSVFIVDPAKKVRLTLTYPPSTGRSFEEILRVLDSLQLTDSHKVATPVDWHDGDDVVILPAISNEDANSMFPKGYEAVKPYLRVTPQPNK